jgi:hypothetical protein
MLDILQDAVNILYDIRDALPEILAEVITENATLIEDANIAQLQEGKRADGSYLPDYSPVSVSKFGKRPGPMTLEQTGRFHRGITVKVYKAQKFVEIIGTDPKTGKLEALYGLNIIGVPEEFIEDFCQNVILPSILEKINKRYLS